MYTKNSSITTATPITYAYSKKEMQDAYNNIKKICTKQSIKLKINDTYSAVPTHNEILNLPLQNIKFFSTHNSFILKSQFKGIVGYTTIIDSLNNLEFYPVCIELDLIFKNDIFYVNHYAQNRTVKKLEEVLLYLKDELILLKKKFKFPLLLSFDISKIKKSMNFYKKNVILLEAIQIQLNQFLLSKECEYCKQTIQDGSILNVPMKDLLGKVLIRYKLKIVETNQILLPDIYFDDNPIKTNNESFYNKSIPYSGENETGRKTKKNKTFEEEMEKYKDKQNSFVRIYPQLTFNKAFQLSLKRTISYRSISNNTNSNYSASSPEIPSYVKVSIQIIKFLFDNNNLNCVAFNYHDLTPDLLKLIRNKFKILYSNYNENTNPFLTVNYKTLNNNSHAGGCKNKKPRKSKKKKNKYKKKHNTKKSKLL